MGGAAAFQLLLIVVEVQEHGLRVPARVVVPGDQPRDAGSRARVCQQPRAEFRVVRADADCPDGRQHAGQPVGNQPDQHAFPQGVGAQALAAVVQQCGGDQFGVGVRVVAQQVPGDAAGVLAVAGSMARYTTCSAG